RRGLRPGSRGHHGRLPGHRPAARGLRGAVAMESRGVRIGIRIAVWALLAFLYVPLAIVVLYAFNPARSNIWPIPGLTLRWFGVAGRNGDVRGALLNSLKAGIGATIIALILGTCASFAVHRFRFFGRNTV